MPQTYRISDRLEKLLEEYVGSVVNFLAVGSMREVSEKSGNMTKWKEQLDEKIKDREDKRTALWKFLSELERKRR